jgi:hypothetical protein
VEFVEAKQSPRNVPTVNWSRSSGGGGGGGGGVDDGGDGDMEFPIQRAEEEGNGDGGGYGNGDGDGDDAEEGITGLAAMANHTMRRKVAPESAHKSNVRGMFCVLLKCFHVVEFYVLLPSPPIPSG